MTREESAERAIGAPTASAGGGVGDRSGLLSSSRSGIGGSVRSYGLRFMTDIEGS